MPLPGVRQGLHPAIEPAAALAEPRLADRAHEEPAVPLSDLRKGVRHREQPAHAHHQGRSQVTRGCGQY